MRQAKRINPQATCFLQYDKLLVDNRSDQYCTFFTLYGHGKYNTMIN